MTEETRQALAIVAAIVFFPLFMLVSIVESTEASHFEVRVEKED